VDLVRGFRTSGQYDIKPTVRKCLMIAKVLAVREARASAADRIFREVVLDVLGNEPMFSDDPSVRTNQQRPVIEELIDRFCPPSGLPDREPAPADEVVYLGGNGHGNALHVELAVESGLAIG
jgi:nitric oxide reductase NorQ protein